MSREFPKLQLPDLFPKVLESGEGTGKFSHGAYIQPQEDVAEGDVPAPAALAVLLYGPKPHIWSKDREEEVEAIRQGSRCAEPFIDQCKALFEKMRGIPEFANLFDQTKYAPFDSKNRPIVSPTTSFVGQFLLSMEDAGDGLFPGVPNGQLLRMKEILEHLYYFFTQMKGRFPGRAEDIARDLKDVVVCGPGAFEKLGDIDAEMFASEGTALDGWLADLRGRVLTTVAGKMVVELGIRSGLQIHMRPALKLAARSEWGLNLKHADREQLDRFVSDLKLTQANYDTAFRYFNKEYADTAAAYVVEHLKKTIQAAFAKYKVGATIPESKFRDFFQALKTFHKDFGISGEYFLQLRELTEEELDEGKETEATLFMSDTVLTNVVLAAFVSRDILDENAYFAFGNDCYLFQHHGTVFYYDKKMPANEGSQPINSWTMENVLSHLSPADIEAMRLSEHALAQNCYRQLPKPAEITAVDLNTTTFSIPTLIRLHEHLLDPELKLVLYAKLLDQVRPGIAADALEKVLLFFQRVDSTFLQQALAVDNTGIGVAHIKLLLERCETPAQITALLAYPQFIGKLSLPGNRVHFTEVLRNKIPLFLQCDDARITTFLKENLTASDAVKAHYKKTYIADLHAAQTPQEIRDLSASPLFLEMMNDAVFVENFVREKHALIKALLNDSAALELRIFSFPVLLMSLSQYVSEPPLKSIIYTKLLTYVRQSPGARDSDLFSHILLFFQREDSRFFNLSLQVHGIEVFHITRLLDACQTSPQLKLLFEKKELEGVLRLALEDDGFRKEFVKSKVTLLMELREQESIRSLLKSTEAALPAMIEAVKSRNDLEFVLAHDFFQTDATESLEQRNAYYAAILRRSFEIASLEDAVDCLNLLFELKPFLERQINTFISTHFEKLLHSKWLSDALLETVFKQKPEACIAALQAMGEAHPNYDKAKAFLASKWVFDFKFSKAMDLSFLVGSPHFSEEHVRPLFGYVVINNIDVKDFSFSEAMRGHHLIRLLRDPHALTPDEKVLIENAFRLASTPPQIIAYIADRACIPSFVKQREFNELCSTLRELERDDDREGSSDASLSNLYEKYQHNPEAVALVLSSSLVVNRGLDCSFRGFRSSVLVTEIIKRKTENIERFYFRSLKGLVARTDVLTADLIMAVLTNVLICDSRSHPTSHFQNVKTEILDPLIENTSLTFPVWLALLGKTVDVDPRTVSSIKCFGFNILSSEIHLGLVFKKYFSNAGFYSEEYPTAYSRLRPSEKEALMKAFLPHIESGVSFLQGLRDLPEYSLLMAINKDVALEKLNNDMVSPADYRALVYNARDTSVAAAGSVVPPVVASAAAGTRKPMQQNVLSGYAELDVVKAILTKEGGKACDLNFLIWVTPYVAHDQTTLDMIAKHPAGKNNPENMGLVSRLAGLSVMPQPKPVENPWRNAVSSHSMVPIRLRLRSNVVPPKLKETLKPAPNYSEFEGNQPVYMAKIKLYLIEQINEYINRRTDASGTSTAIQASFFGKKGDEKITEKKVMEAKRLLAEIRGADDIPACKAALEKSIQANKDIVSWTTARQGDLKMVLSHCVNQCDLLMDSKAPTLVRASRA